MSPHPRTPGAPRAARRARCAAPRLPRHSAPIAGGVAAGLAAPPRRAGAVGAGLLRGHRLPRRLRADALRRAVGVPARRPALRGRRARPRERDPHRQAPRRRPRGCVTPDRRSRSGPCSSAWSSASRAIFGQGVLFWPVVLGVAGIALLWRQADEAQRERWMDSSGPHRPVPRDLRQRRLGRLRPHRRRPRARSSPPSSSSPSPPARSTFAGAGAGRRPARHCSASPSSSARGRCAWSTTSAPSGPSASAPRSAPTWPRTCTTRCCRPWP